MFRRKCKEENWFEEQEKEILNELNNWDVGTPEYEERLELLIRFIKGKKELDKERDEKFFREMELLIRLISVGGGLAFSWVFMNKGFKFEETGVLTSGTFQRFLNSYNKRKDFS